MLAMKVGLKPRSPEVGVFAAHTHSPAFVLQPAVRILKTRVVVKGFVPGWCGSVN